MNEASAQYERLRRKRAHRRGQVTRIQHAISEMSAKRYSEISLSDLERLKKNLDKEIEAHEALHDQMEDLAAADEELLHAEHSERDKHDAVHAELLNVLGNLHNKIDLWGAGMDLHTDLEALQALKEPGKPHFIKAFAEFRKGVKDLGHQCRGYSDDDNISAVIKTLQDAVTNLNLCRKSLVSSTVILSNGVTSVTCSPLPSRPEPVVSVNWIRDAYS